MGILDFFKGPNINEGVNQYQSTPKAILLDVRSDDEYNQGHIPGSTHLALDRIHTARKHIRGLDTPLFVYCLSGSRSAQAVQQLKQMGYTNVQNIGGISSYKGKVEY